VFDFSFNDLQLLRDRTPWPSHKCQLCYQGHKGGGHIEPVDVF
jgi:hypothetical protein